MVFLKDVQVLGHYHQQRVTATAGHGFLSRNEGVATQPLIGVVERVDVLALLFSFLCSLMDHSLLLSSSCIAMAWVKITEQATPIQP